MDNDSPSLSTFSLLRGLAVCQMKEILSITCTQERGILAEKGPLQRRYFCFPKKYFFLQISQISLLAAIARKPKPYATWASRSTHAVEHIIQQNTSLLSMNAGGQ
jgi:hypothetical protein